MIAPRMTKAAGMVLATVFVAPGTALAAGEFVWPVNGYLTATTVYPGGADHQGASADIAAPMWTPIGASRGGSSSAYWEGGGCGNYAWITHPAGYITLYCHLVNRPTTGSVGNNQTLGYIGVTGNTTGPHVHWAIRRYGSRMYIPGSYIGMRVARGQACNGSYPGLSGSATTGTTGTTGTVIPPANIVMYRLKLLSDMNVRSGPGTTYARVGGLANGTIVDLYGFAAGGWVKIWYGGAWRYILGTYSVKVGLSVQLTSDLNVRSGPGTGYAKIGMLPKNAIIHCWAWSGGWYKVWFNGAWRWIYSLYTRKA